jgi:hypothetical protein
MILRGISAGGSMRYGESNMGPTGLANVECVWIASKCIQKVGKNTEVSVVMQE